MNRSCKVNEEMEMKNMDTVYKMSAEEIKEVEAIQKMYEEALEEATKEDLSAFNSSYALD